MTSPLPSRTVEVKAAGSSQTGRSRDHRAASGARPDLFLEDLIDSVAGHDAYTCDHSHRVARYAEAISAVMKLNARDTMVITRAALLHDIGKLGIAESLLQKSEPLSANERRIIELHPLLGAGMLAHTPGMARITHIVLHHHERWDGAGYPRGLAGEAIPLESRVIFVADAIDAMVSERPYGKTRTLSWALAEVRRCAGRQFDPTVVSAATKAFSAGLLAA